MPISVTFFSAATEAMRVRLMTVYSVRKMLVKPRLGKRRCSGIWPPSKPRIRLEPVRDPWPLWPRVEVLPMPEPIPRPTRLRPVFALRGARRFDRFFAMFFLAVAPDKVDPCRLAFLMGAQISGFSQSLSAQAVVRRRP